MTTEQIVGLILTLLIMLIGFIGSIAPGLPGTPLVLAAAVGHRLYFGQHSVSWLIMILLIVLTLISLVLDYLASYYGAKKFGATWRGGLGAAIGGLVGIFFGLPGILLGPFLGAMLLELIGGHEFEKAAKAGAGATLGLFAGAIGKCAICVMMIGLFTINVIYRS
ncbi:MAG TPA: DUF456 domain-containing protein [Verrucomicrobiae bacterium]|nr:DUF456 domain-containing protein [Verrucomicrobiae bacterium]